MGQAHTGSFLAPAFLSPSPPSQWKKHWFVLTDSSLKYYRDSTAEEVRCLGGWVLERAGTQGQGVWSVAPQGPRRPWWILLL